MVFLLTGIWWMFFILGALSYCVSSFGHHGRGSRSPQIEAIGGFGLIVFVILSFIFSGWKGGIGIVIALFLWAVIAERGLWLIFRKLMPSASNMGYSQFIKRSRSSDSLSKIPTSLGELREEWDKKDQMLLKISNQPKIIEVLQKHEKTPAELKDVFSNLIRGGAGEYVAQSVIENPELLSEYFRMKSDNVSDIEITSKLAKSLGGP